MKKLIYLLVLLVLHNFAISQNKIALVIGNADYKNQSLRNPENDASDMSNTLSKLGFKVTLGTNLGRQQMEDAIRQFSNYINNGDIALFYFSGHGTQVKGLNYLIPVGESITTETDIRYKCVEASFVLDYMERGNSSMNIVILDACRDNPFKGFKSSSRGFAYMSAPTGTFISYATAPGSVAFDGTGRNSPYTAALLEKMQIQGLKLEEVFKKVREKVMATTGERQIPWESSSIVGDFYFIRGEYQRDENITYYQNDATNDEQVHLIEESPPVNISHEDFPGNSGVFTDIRDGQKYNWVRIGKQIWMAEHMNYVTRKGSWIYSRIESTDAIYGRLYNWQTALNACPNGWHLPSDAEWTELTDYLGGANVASGMLKEVGTTHWNRPDSYATNETGFTALPGGYCSSGIRAFYSIGYYCRLWSSTEYDATSAWYRSMSDIGNQVRRTHDKKGTGFSVRCLRD